MTTKHHLDLSADSKHYLDGAEKLKADIEKTAQPIGRPGLGVGWE
jgi:hypothetical protein